MKIGIVSPYRLDKPGGVQEHIRSLARGLRKRNHQVTVISPGFGFREEAERIYLGRTVKVPTPNGSWAYVSAFFSPTPESLKGVLGSRGFDILHFHEPLVPFLCWQILQVSAAVNVATFHSEWRLTAETTMVDSLQFLLNPLLPRFLERISGSIAVSSAARESWPEFFGGQRVEAVIPNGVSLQRFTPTGSRQEVFPGHPTILYVGRLETRKGLPLLLNAFEKLVVEMPETRLVVVGSGPLFLPMKTRVREKGLQDRVYFAGRVSAEDLPEYYRGADVFCSPAVGGESFGIVLLEAMASGVPLVAFDNPGYRCVLGNCPVPESLVDCGNEEALATSLKTILLEADQRERLRRWGLEEARRYSWDRVVGEVEEFYRLAVRERSNSGPP